MPVLSSRVEVASEAYQRNRAAQLAAVAALNEQLELFRDKSTPLWTGH